MTFQFRFKIRALLLTGFLVCGGIGTIPGAFAKEPAAKPTDEISLQTTDIPYKTGGFLSKLEKEKCKLDVYLPATGKDFPLIVWFHGGGFTQGDKKDDTKVANSLTTNGIAFVSVNYRLNPGVKFPAYVEDAAAAVAWARANMSRYGADVKKFFVGGHSAGAYIALLLGQDEQYLKAEGMSLKDITGLLPVSSQIMTHFTIREERGMDKNRVIADEASPMYHARKDAPPMLLLLGDKDWPARYEENVYFAKYCEVIGNKFVFLLQVKGRDHGGIFNKLADPADAGRKALLKFVESSGKTMR